MIGAGYRGAYETQDNGSEHSYTYGSIGEARGRFGAILLLDVLEHLPLRDGLTMLHSLLAKLETGGALILQTPNGRCIRSPFTSDMTHVQSYNLPDLWAYLTAAGCAVDGYRVVFGGPTPLHRRVLALASRAVITRLLGLDYADNILLLARKA